MRMHFLIAENLVIYTAADRKEKVPILSKKKITEDGPCAIT